MACPLASAHLQHHGDDLLGQGTATETRQGVEHLPIWASGCSPGLEEQAGGLEAGPLLEAGLGRGVDSDGTRHAVSYGDAQQLPAGGQGGAGSQQVLDQGRRKKVTVTLSLSFLAMR